jgi:hypothetical protein
MAQTPFVPSTTIENCVFDFVMLILLLCPFYAYRREKNKKRYSRKGDFSLPPSFSVSRRKPLYWQWMR